LGLTSTVLLLACAQQKQSGAIQSLAKGQGAVLEIDGSQVAVYKDESGKVTQLSPVCPHAGCTVQWNAADKTWDCPCHGSRFQTDGAFMSGPAGKGLEEVG
jgi:Rieske Fe-S protein